MAVPMIFLNGQPFGSGRMEIGEILAKIDTGAAARDAKKLAAKDVFDVLIVGGGPAGAAAAVYAARKGIRTGIVASASAARRWTRWASRTSSRCWRPRTEVRRGAGGTRAAVQRRHHRRPAGRGARTGGHAGRRGHGDARQCAQLKAGR